MYLTPTPAEHSSEQRLEGGVSEAAGPAVKPAPISPGHVTGIGRSSGGGASSRGRRRSDKPKLSCNRCRQRKERCDRQQPCAKCEIRREPCTYSYSDSSSRPLLPKPPPTTHSTSTSTLQYRIDQLERLVVSLMPAGAGSTPRAVPAQYFQAGAAAGPGRPEPTSGELGPVSGPGPGPGQDDPDNIDIDPSECGSMRITSSELRYLSSEHWVAILDSIAGLKDHFHRADSDTPSPSEEQFKAPGNANHGDKQAPPGCLLLYGFQRPASRVEVMAALPARATVDRLMSRYFNHVDLVATSAVHGPSFLDEYQAFWADPSSVPILWIGLLFSMICLATMSMSQDVTDFSNQSSEDDNRLQVQLYREKVVHCLLLGHYTHPGPYALETVIHYVYIEMAFSADSSQDLWFLLGLEVTLAMRMGYHRDPSHFSGVPPLQAEMRRRLWVTVLLGDILISSQMGMPRMISESQYDTAEPRNLYDTDLAGITTAGTSLPDARPETEQTTTLEIIARRRIIVVLGTISDLSVSVRSHPHVEIMRVDATLNAVATSIPPPLRMKPLALGMTDPPQIIMSRLFLAHLIYKGQIMLHRRFLFMEPCATKDGPGDPFAYSRKACVDACLGTLQIQHTLNEETCPGGQLYSRRWRISSIMNHQFLTATMVLCSLLGRHMQRPHQKLLVKEDEQSIRTALRKTWAIWDPGNSPGSREAEKAASAVSIVLAAGEDGLGSQKDKLDVQGSGDDFDREGLTGLDVTSLFDGDIATNYGVSQTWLQGTGGQYEFDNFLSPAFNRPLAFLSQQSEDQDMVFPAWDNDSTMGKLDLPGRSLPS